LNLTKEASILFVFYLCMHYRTRGEGEGNNLARWTPTSGSDKRVASTRSLAGCFR